MLIGCWPQTVKELQDMTDEFQYSNGCFETMKSNFDKYRIIAYRLEDLNHSQKTEGTVKELIEFFNNHFKCDIVFHKIGEVSKASYANLLWLTNQGDLRRFVNAGGDFPTFPKNEFCYFSLKENNTEHGTINYFNFTILRMLFNSTFKELFDNFFNLLDKIDIQPFELFQLCHYCKAHGFESDKNIMSNVNISRIVKIDTLHQRMKNTKKLYDCYETIQSNDNSLVQKFKDEKYMEIYEALK